MNTLCFCVLVVIKCCYRLRLSLEVSLYIHFITNIVTLNSQSEENISILFFLKENA